MKNKTFIIVGAILLIAIISIVAYSVAENNTRTKAQAEAETTPKNIRISELSQTSFTLEWETDAEFSGYIFYSTDPENVNLLGQDVNGTYKFINHIVTISYLEPGTTYYYVIVSEGDTYQSEGVPFTVTTLE